MYVPIKTRRRRSVVPDTVIKICYMAFYLFGQACGPAATLVAKSQLKSVAGIVLSTYLYKSQTFHRALGRTGGRKGDVFEIIE